MIDAAIDRIDRATFALWMGILADRFARELKAPTLRVYYELLAEELDTTGFVRGCRAVVKREQFFPSVQQIIDAANGDGEVAIAGLRAFRAIEDGAYPYTDDVAREAMKLCGLWGSLGDMAPGTRAQKERQFLEVFATIARQRRSIAESRALDPGPAPRSPGVAQLIPAAHEGAPMRGGP
jgi:hypothetical protein